MSNEKKIKLLASKLAAVISCVCAGGCTFERQNKISRTIQDWTGDHGVLDVLSHGRVMYRFINIDRLSVGSAAEKRGFERSYRYGYGFFDANQNYQVDDGEKKVYFEVGDSPGNYSFYESPVSQ